MMLNYTERLTQLGYSPDFAVLAYDKFVKSLKSDETILYLMEGSIKNSIGVIVATDKRIYYIGVDKHNNTLQEDIGYNDIIFINGKDTPWVTMEIRVQTDSKFEELVVKGCSNEEGKQFIELIRLLTIKPT